MADIGFTLDNYRRVLTARGFWPMLRTTFIYATLGTCASHCARAYGRNRRARRLPRTPVVPRLAADTVCGAHCGDDAGVEDDAKRAVRNCKHLAGRVVRLFARVVLKHPFHAGFPVWCHLRCTGGTDHGYLVPGLALFPVLVPLLSCAAGGVVRGAVRSGEDRRRDADAAVLAHYAAATGSGHRRPGSAALHLDIQQIRRHLLADGRLLRHPNRYRKKSTITCSACRTWAQLRRCLWCLQRSWPYFSTSTSAGFMYKKPSAC